MMNKPCILVIGTCLVITACHSDSKATPEAQQAVSTDGGGVIPQHQLKALEKAKAVEQMIIDAEQARLQQAEGNDDL